VVAEEEKALADLRTQLTERERKWHETAAEHASTVATAQVPPWHMLSTQIMLPQHASRPMSQEAHALYYALTHILGHETAR
jgi:hypothetical protein